MRSLRWTCVLLSVGCAELPVPGLEPIHPASPAAPEAPLAPPSILQSPAPSASAAQQGDRHDR